MDSGDSRVFMFLNDKGEGTPFGSLYISHDRRNFALSLENVIQGEAVDFAKVESLPGTYIANKYAP